VLRGSSGSGRSPAIHVDRHGAIDGQAIVAEAKGELDEAFKLYTDTARRWNEYGYVLEEGQALLGTGWCLVTLGRTQDSSPAPHDAREVFVKLGARPLLDETDTYIHQATVLSSWQSVVSL
jgi:hypothetical protein